MAKIIQSPALEVYHIKAMVPYWEQMDYDPDEDSPYRILAIRPDMGLLELGVCVLSAFEFEYDHMFGFYDNLKKYRSSKVSFEHPQLIEHANNEGWRPGSSNRNKQTHNMEDYCVADIFTRKGKKWLMLFDYGDKWHFWLTLEDRARLAEGTELPQIMESKYDAPEQYED